MLVKLEWLGYRIVKKLWRYVKPFSSDRPTGTLRTDRRTYRQTERFAISISRVSMLTRYKNEPWLLALHSAVSRQNTKQVALRQYLERSFFISYFGFGFTIVRTIRIRFCFVVFGVTSSLAVIYRDCVGPIVRERAWSLSRWWTTETVTLSRVALGGWIPAVYDQRYNCYNLRDSGRCPPATMFTIPRLLQRQQQAGSVPSESRFLPTPPACIRHPHQGGVEFYLYPTVSTALIHSVKPELTE